MYKNLLEVCVSENQKKVVETLLTGVTQTEAAKILGKNRRTIEKTLQTLRRRAEAYGKSNHYIRDISIPNGLPVSGTSTLVKTEDGLQWIKTKASDQSRLEMLESSIDALREDLPKYKPNIKSPQNLDSKLVNKITLTDLHVGMFADAKYCGNDWNLKISEETAEKVFFKLISTAPKAKTCYIQFLGDLAHYDNAKIPITPSSGHILSTDGRLQDIVKVLIRLIRRIVDYALEFHEEVIIGQIEGNHDFAGTIWMREFLEQFYENESRITVLECNRPYLCWSRDKIMLNSYHGHGIKLEKLPIIFATEFPIEWGSTEHRYIDTGDKHHKFVKDVHGVIIRQHPTIEASDQWTVEKGLNSVKRAERITYHVDEGECSIDICSPSMVM